MARLAKVVAPDRTCLTAEWGTIVFTADGERLWVATEK